MVHRTAELEVPVTLAVNCWVWELNRLTEAGVIVIDAAGTSVTIALADLVGSELNVAVNVTVSVLLIFFGAW
jgi:hypothetical protein